ncbi:hypothetical protein PRIPAC_73283 [Pristionchus pacificus]|uniref:Uncharacterized protein n=1 Tax=Pristionchus pacificus TaxID=54126 RepID=A0A2A6CFK7_PRIPA|nr:hypothetical protein PRIPAC_73283 [Pristionchus pacificus]|eukprot:PDM76896.1 hypothetical protein PRIPAC_42291 [Pristionchus pacificus]
MRFLILFFVLFLCLKAGFDDDEMSVMNEFGANMMTHYIRKDSYTLWKETSECENDCSLLLSIKEGSDSICAELCGFHFSYSNKEREAYEKEIKELFHTFLKNARFRLV